MGQIQNDEYRRSIRRILRAAAFGFVVLAAVLFAVTARVLPRGTSSFQTYFVGLHQVDGIWQATGFNVAPLIASDRFADGMPLGISPDYGSEESCDVSVMVRQAAVGWPLTAYEWWSIEAGAVQSPEVQAAVAAVQREVGAQRLSWPPELAGRLRCSRFSVLRIAVDVIAVVSLVCLEFGIILAIGSRFPRRRFLRKSSLDFSRR